MEEYKQSFGIKSWAEEDRPREKLLNKGIQALTEAELIAILIGSGSRNETAVELSKRILSSVENNLGKIGKLTIHDLMKFKGIGEAKAITIVAAFELGRRRKEDVEIMKRVKVTNSSIIYDIMRPVMMDLPHEEFWLILLNRGNIIMRKEMISRGGLAGTVADVRIMFKIAIDNLACSIVVCHNHPSGNLTPSDSDISITKSIKAVGNFMDIPLQDHLIIAENGYYSFVDAGML